MAPSEGLCEKTHPQVCCVVPGLRLLAIMIALSTESFSQAWEDRCGDPSLRSSGGGMWRELGDDGSRTNNNLEHRGM